MKLDLIRDNAATFGVKWAAERARKQGVNLDDCLIALGFRRCGVSR